MWYAVSWTLQATKTLGTGLEGTELGRTVPCQAGLPARCPAHKLKPA